MRSSRFGSGWALHFEALALACAELPDSVIGGIQVAWLVDTGAISVHFAEHGANFIESAYYLTFGVSSAR